MARSSDLDKVLAYRNLLAAEDHLLELDGSLAISSDERGSTKYLLEAIRNIRDHIMPAEKDSRYHCIAKHLCTAYEALVEMEKQWDEEYLNHGKAPEPCPYTEARRTLWGELLEVLSKLWGRDIPLCERCTDEVEEEDGADRTEAQQQGADGESLINSIDG